MYRFHKNRVKPMIQAHYGKINTAGRVLQIIPGEIHIRQVGSVKLVVLEQPTELDGKTIKFYSPLWRVSTIEQFALKDYALGGRAVFAYQEGINISIYTTYLEQDRISHHWFPAIFSDIEDAFKYARSEAKDVSAFLTDLEMTQIQRAVVRPEWAVITPQGAKS